MLDEKILKYAVVGIDSEIDKLEKVIKQGKMYLNQLEAGEKPKTSKTEYEIQDIIRKKKEEIERLASDKDKIKWKLSEYEQ